MIAITGANGFVGAAVLREAQAAGLEIRAIVRDLETAQWVADLDGVEVFHGNVIHAPSLQGAFDGVQAVIHLVGIINEWKENTFQRAHVDATVNVLAAAKEAGVKRYLHMSALGTRADAVSRYHRTKWQAEEAVRKSGLAWTIFRPSLIYGPHDKSISVLSRMVRRAPFVPVLGNGQSRIQPVAVENVARAFIRALRDDRTVEQTYDLVGPSSFTWNELYDQLLEHHGLRKPKIHLPLWLAGIQARVLEKMFKYPPFNREQIAMSREDNVGNPQPAVQDLGLDEETFSAALARYLV